MEPSKPGAEATTGSKETESQLKPSLGESFIEGMRGLNIADSRGEEPQATSKVHFSTPDTAPNSSKPLGKMSGGNANLGVARNHSDRPLSSSQLPKPRDSMLESLARHVDTPSVRQTKTSAMRLRHSIGKTAWGSSEKKQEKDGRLNPIREKIQSPSTAGARQSRQVSPGGPFRSTSRSRHAVTARGSPYTIPSRFNPKLNKALPEAGTGTNIGRSAEVTSPTNIQQSRRPEDIATQPFISSRQASRQSSIPLPNWGSYSAHGMNNEGTEDEDHSAGLDEETNAYRQGHDDAQALASAHVASAATTPDGKHSDTIEAQVGEDTTLLTMREVLSTPAPRDDESVIESEASGGTVRGSDSLGGFKVKRVRNTPEGGPTLRITDSASQILLGDEQEPDATSTEGSSPPLRVKSSAPDLRQPTVLQEPPQRSSGFLARPLSFARSITERSQSHTKESDDEETRKLIDTDKPDGGALPAELPGNDIDVEKQSFVESRTSLDVVGAAAGDELNKPGALSVTHGDWPSKEFADFKITTGSPPKHTEKKASPVPSTEELANPSSSRTSVRSRPSTIVLRQAPTKEVSPFLFQDLEQEKAGQEKYLSDFMDKAKGPQGDAISRPAFPARTSSRKPKPPPIIVSSPERGLSVNTFPSKAAKAYGVDPNTIQKPKNGNLFSQSVNQNTDASNARKVAHQLSYSPSSSSKKVISNIRGLFHKRSIESTTTAESNMSGNKTLGKSRLPSSMRRKPVADHKLSNPLSVNQSGTTAPNLTRGQDNLAPGERSVLRNPFISPTTPFTATVRPSPVPASPTLPNFESPGTSPSLSAATALTHTLLDLARAEANPQRKTSLIELSKCMVAVVNSARDAEKAMEKAKMEAARAEVSWLKVQKEASTVEGTVRAFLHPAGGN